MKLVKIFFILLCFLSFNIRASDLISHLNEFFKKKFSLDKNNFKILVHTPLKKKHICKKPYFSLSNHLYHIGLFDVLYTCGKKYQHLKIELQVKEKYIVARKKILRGTKIKESDLKTIVGPLDNLPNGTYLNKKDVINRVNFHDIMPFQPITSFMTHVCWIIKANQQVTIKMKGINFEIITFGKALNNGGIKEEIHIKIKNGKIITGTINKHAEVIVIL